MITQKVIIYALDPLLLAGLLLVGLWDMSVLATSPESMVISGIGLGLAAIPLTHKGKKSA